MRRNKRTNTCDYNLDYKPYSATYVDNLLVMDRFVIILLCGIRQRGHQLLPATQHEPHNIVL
jgi:hypothetical protein